MPDTSWMKDANCKSAGPDIFFPGSGAHDRDANKKRREALLLCWGCDVRSECLEYALKHESKGLWGGMTDRQRRKIRRQRGITLQDPSAGHLVYELNGRTQEMAS